MLVSCLSHSSSVLGAIPHPAVELLVCPSVQRPYSEHLPLILDERSTEKSEQERQYRKREIGFEEGPRTHEFPVKEHPHTYLDHVVR
jgi:hypothetical protein